MRALRRGCRGTDGDDRHTPVCVYCAVAKIVLCAQAGEAERFQCRTLYVERLVLGVGPDVALGLVLRVDISRV